MAMQNITSLIDHTNFIPFPYLFGQNLLPLVNVIPDIPLSISNCDRWFMTDFAKNASQDSKEYWGVNTGQPWTQGKSKGIIGSNNVLQQPCSSIQRNSPYFQDFKNINHENMDKY